MNQRISRRNWLKNMTAGMAGLIAAERLGYAQSKDSERRTADMAVINPKDAIKITKLEIIPVNSLRSVFVKLHTDAGIIGLGEGTVEGRIKTTVAAIEELEGYLMGKDPRQVAHQRAVSRRHRDVGHQGQGSRRTGL
jgi:galactonate dehydratase